MPQKAPKIDTRAFADLQEESHELIERYVPQWTTRDSSDLGMTMLMAFNRMQESIMHRLNRVPDKHYITFLNFIGEKRNAAAPSVASLTFSSYLDEPIELQRQAKVSTRQKREGGAKSFLTVTPLTVHSSKLMNCISVQGGKTPMCRQQMIREEEPAIYALQENALISQAKIFNNPSKNKEGVSFFDLDPLIDGPLGYTPSQNIYVGHPSFIQGERGGHITICNSKGDSLVPFFDWFVFQNGNFAPIEVIDVEDAVGKNIPVLKVEWEKLQPITIPIDKRFLSKELPDAVRRELNTTYPYLIGAIQYDRWLTQCFRDDLKLFWRDDRGGDEQEIFDWNIFQQDNEISFSLEDLPPISTGWSVKFQFVDRRLPAGHKRYLPTYEWYYQTIEGWERIDSSQVRVEKSRIVLVGPFPQMVSQGQQFKAIRREAVAIDKICPDLDVQVTWERPIEHFLYQSEDADRISKLETDQVAWNPFQYSSTFPPTIGSAMLISSDLLLNDHMEPVTLDITYGFTINGDPFTENPDLYALRLLYRAKDSWRVVWHPDQLYSRFTFHELRETEDIEQEKEDDAEQKSMLSGLASMGSEEKPKPIQKKYTIRIELDPRDNLEGIERHELENVSSGWLRFELIKANLMGEDAEKQKHPIQLTVYNVDLRKKTSPRDKFFEDKLLSPRCAQLTERTLNARFTKLQYRYQGNVYEYFPNLRCIDLTEEKSFIYLNFDQPLPIGARHSMYVRCQGEQFFADRIMWEVLEEGQGGTLYWRRLSNQNHFSFQRSGFLQFSIQEELRGTYEGFWIRGSFPSLAPTLPQVSHILLNTVEGVNLHQHRTERFSGMGTVNQDISLLYKPTFSTLAIQDHREFSENWDGIRVLVKESSSDNIDMIGFGEEDGSWVEWKEISEHDMKYADKNDRVFWMDNVDGTIHFGNGIHGMILPYGSNNVLVDLYYEVPGKYGNVGKGEIVVCDAHSSLQVTNFFPSIGGRDSESTAELLARDPILLTTRDRAVTRRDFESLALQASEEVARVKCGITDGHIEVVVLPRSALLGVNSKEEQRRGIEPDLSMALGLRDHVSDFLRQRSLIALDFSVRLVRILPIDVHLELRVQKGANIEEMKEQATTWLRTFLDPFAGGFQGEGWEFGATLFEADLHRISGEHPDIRNLARVNFYPVRKGMTWPGWEEGMGLSEVQLNEHDLVWTRYIKISYIEI